MPCMVEISFSLKRAKLRGNRRAERVRTKELDALQHWIAGKKLWAFPAAACQRPRTPRFFPFLHTAGLLPTPASAKIHKIHSPENPCKQFLRWKMEGSSAAEATVRKANVTGK